MKQHPFTRPLTLALGALLFASCATQEEYQKAADLAEHYQEQLFEAEAKQARLEADNEQLRRELSISQVKALEASSIDPDLQARIEDFEQRLAEMRTNPDMIQRFELGGGAYVYSVPDAVLFASGSAQVNDEGRRALVDRVAADINSAAHGRIWIRGHTDSDRVVKPATLQKFPHGNLQLSAARAIEVAAILTGPGDVPEDQVVIAGFGPLEPLVANDTAENKALNRRVEIYVSAAR